MDTIPLDDVARQLGQQLLQILSLQQRIATQQQEIAAREKRLGEIEAECERLRMEITRRGLDEAVANARHKSTRSEPSDEQERIKP